MRSRAEEIAACLVLALTLACEGAPPEPKEPEEPGVPEPEPTGCAAKHPREEPVAWYPAPPENLDPKSLQFWEIRINREMTCSPPYGEPRTIEGLGKAMEACFECIREWIHEHGCSMVYSEGSETSDLRVVQCSHETIDALRLHPDVEWIAFQDQSHGGAGG